MHFGVEMLGTTQEESGVSISAADIEKYFYCPLSWKLSYNPEDKESESQKSGKREHKKIGRRVREILHLEDEVARAETIIFIGGVVASSLAIAGAVIYSPIQNFIFSRIMLILCLIWLAVALFFLYISAFFSQPKLQLLMISASLAGILFLLSMLTNFQEPKVGFILEALALFWLIFASLFFLLAELYNAKAMGIARKLRIEQKIVKVEGVMRTKDGRLSGKPDLVLKSGQHLIPVEIKTGRVPQGPHFSHIMQVIAYCYIIEDLYGKPPPYGVLRYSGKEFKIEYTPKLKALLEEKVEEMRRAIAGEIEVHRNHKREGKCRNCSRREICKESLV